VQAAGSSVLDDRLQVGAAQQAGTLLPYGSCCTQQLLFCINEAAQPQQVITSRSTCKPYTCNTQLHTIIKAEEQTNLATFAYYTAATASIPQPTLDHLRNTRVAAEAGTAEGRS
jgi:hypothetical protein